MIGKIKNLHQKRAGQVFSLDAFFSLLAIMLIFGTSLQYIYLSGEELGSLHDIKSLEFPARATADIAYAAYIDDPLSPTMLIQNGDCQNLVQGSITQGQIPDVGYWLEAADLAKSDNYMEKSICEECYPQENCGTGDKLYLFNNANQTTASVVRFMLAPDASGSLVPGRIATVSFNIWKEQ